MKEDGGACSGDGLGVGIVSDKELQGMRVVILAHLGLFFPRVTGLMTENKVFVVMWRGGVLDPEIASGDLAVAHAGSPFYGFSISPDSAKLEDSGRRAPITLCLNRHRSGFRMETSTPREALFSTAATPRSASLLPGLPLTSLVN